MLEICKSFFDFLNSSHIKYCHWKSNSHLDLSLNGKTDLDLLIHVRDRSRFEHACQKFKIIKILSPPEKRFPGLEDYLGFDYDTGKLIHLHIHYQLILGQKYIKNHHIPLESFIFDNLILRNGIYIPIVEIELLLLIIRSHMKMDLVTLLKHSIRNLQCQFYCPFPRTIEEELIELIKNCNIEVFKRILLQSKLPIPLSLFLNFIDKFSSKKYMCYDAFKNEIFIHRSLRTFKRKKGISAHLTYLYLSFLNTANVAKLLQNKKKVLPNRGKTFSLVGADGSGKSSLFNDLTEWLSWKMVVGGHYYGIPKRHFFSFLDYLIQISKKFHFSSLTLITKRLLWILIAKSRYNIYLLSKQDARKGKIVITDRFPLKEFRSMKDPMDGPRLGKDYSKIGRYFSTIESNYYKNIRIPDYIFVLQVNIDELRRRKTDLSLSTHQLKASAVNSITKSDHIILIDANKPYDEVLLEIKRYIWQLL